MKKIVKRRANFISTKFGGGGKIGIGKRGRAKIPSPQPPSFLPARLVRRSFNAGGAFDFCRPANGGSNQSEFRSKKVRASFSNCDQSLETSGQLIFSGIMRKIGVIFIALLFFSLLVFFLGPPGFVSRANTEYTKNFSTEKFNTVKIGMTEEQVLTILGEPMNRYTDDRIHLSYSKTKNSFSDFTGWESVRIELNNEHIVIGVASNIFFN